MAVASTREEFKDYILRDLGHPVIDINVSDDQVEDRIDEALKYYHDYHFDGSEKAYLKHQITQQDKDRGYIEMSNDVLGVIKIFDASPMTSVHSLFNIKYQFMLNEMFNLTSSSLVPYYLALHHIEMLNHFFNAVVPLRFNRHSNRLYMDIDKERVPVGEYIIVECYIKTLDNGNIWGDRWLARYAAALVKKQWGGNLKKFNLTLPGNVQYNGQAIFNEAEAELQKLEDEMIDSYSIPVGDIIG